MAKNHKKTFACPLCQRERPLREAVPAEFINPSMVPLVIQRLPNWLETQEPLCMDCVNQLRTTYIQQVIEEEQHALSSLSKAVDKSLKAQESLGQNINVQFERELTFGERMADRIATFGGSWPFIGMFFMVLISWIALNTTALFDRAFDPYPFILLNLVLSCLAALQAPIIMMSQNRQEAKDRMRSEYDYRVNLKAELEIRHLHAKLDMLLTHQWQRLLEIQQLQMEMMEQIARHGQAKPLPPTAAPLGNPPLPPEGTPKTDAGAVSESKPTSA